MKRGYIVILISIVVIIFAAVLMREDVPEQARIEQLIELPRPNSGEFTFEQAEARKSEIYQMQLTGPMADWTPPEMGLGFCVHISKDDSISIKHLSKPPFGQSEVERYVRNGIEKLTGNRYVENPNHVYRDISLVEFEEFIQWAWIGNQAAFVVLTSELKPGHSSVFPQVLDCLFKPSIMLHYVPQN